MASRGITAAKAKLWTKMLVGGGIMCIGGPALIYYVSPTEEQLINYGPKHMADKRIQSYNPDLKRRALANREQRQQDFDSFVTKLKEYSKSDKPIWEAAAEDETRTRMAQRDSHLASEAERAKLREEIRQQALSGR